MFVDPYNVPGFRQICKIQNQAAGNLNPQRPVGIGPKKSRPRRHMTQSDGLTGDLL